jgi:hypothetical protein
MDGGPGMGMKITDCDSMSVGELLALHFGRTFCVL